MAKYTLRRKTFTDEARQAFAEKKAGTLQGSLADRTAQLKAENAAKSAQQAVDRAARKVTGTALQGQAGQISKAVGKEGYQKIIDSTSKAVKVSGRQGYQKGIQSAGIKQGVMNTWRNAGAMGKTGMAAAGVAGAGLLAKGLFGGNKSKQAAS